MRSVRRPPARLDGDGAATPVRRSIEAGPPAVRRPDGAGVTGPVRDESRVAERMAKTIANYERREPLVFDEGGRRLQTQAARRQSDDGFAIPKHAVYRIENGFRPSLESCVDMVLEHQRTGRPVTYDQARWDADPRIDEAIAALTDDAAAA